MAHTFSNDDLVRVLQATCAEYEQHRAQGTMPAAARLNAITTVLDGVDQGRYAATPRLAGDITDRLGRPLLRSDADYLRKAAAADGVQVEIERHDLNDW